MPLTRSATASSPLLLSPSFLFFLFFLFPFLPERGERHLVGRGVEGVRVGTKEDLGECRGGTSKSTSRCDSRPCALRCFLSPLPFFSSPPPPPPFFPFFVTGRPHGAEGVGKAEANDLVEDQNDGPGRALSGLAFSLSPSFFLPPPFLSCRKGTDALDIVLTMGGREGRQKVQQMVPPGAQGG